MKIGTWRLTLVFSVLFTACALMMAADSAVAAKVVRDGTKACPGAYFRRDVSDVYEVHDSFYVLRNVDESRTVTIEHLRAWDRDGALIWDSEEDGLPAGAKEILSPHEGSVFRASGLTRGAFLPEGKGTVIQVRMKYSVDGKRKRVPLTAGVVRFARVEGLESFRFRAPCLDQ